MRIKDVANVIIKIEGRKYFGGGIVNPEPPEEGGGGNIECIPSLWGGGASTGSVYADNNLYVCTYQINNKPPQLLTIPANDPELEHIPIGHIIPKYIPEAFDTTSSNGFWLEVLEDGGNIFYRGMSSSNDSAQITPETNRLRFLETSQDVIASLSISNPTVFVQDLYRSVIPPFGSDIFSCARFTSDESSGGGGEPTDYNLVISSLDTSNGRVGFGLDLSGVEGNYEILRDGVSIASGFASSEDGGESVYVSLDNLGGKAVGININVDKANSFNVSSDWTSEYDSADRIITVNKFVDNIPVQRFTTWYSELSVPRTLPTFITNVDNMFYNCAKFNSDLSLWDMSRFTNLEYMFYGCEIFNSDLSMWDVSNVINMEGLFLGCRRFTSNLSNWNVGRVQNFTSTFQGATVFNSDLSNWNTISAITMSGMFRLAHSFASFVTEWDVSNVANMDYMFQPESGVFTALPPQDLSKWCVANVYGAMDFINYDWSGIKPIWGTCPPRVV